MKQCGLVQWEVVMIVSVQGTHRFRTSPDLTELAVRATMQVRAGASAPGASVGRDKDGVSPSDGVRSKIAELVKTTKTFPDSGPVAAGNRGDSYGTTSRVEDEMRSAWSQDLSGLIAAKSASEKSIRLSREKEEVWLCVPGETDPARQFYRLENQPENFEEYMKLKEEASRGLDMSIAMTRDMLAGVDKPTPAQAETLAKVDLMA